MRRLPPATIPYVAHTCVSLAFGASAVLIAAQPTFSPIRQSKTVITRGQSSGQLSTGAIVRYPTMLDMTYPEFEIAVKKTNVVLLPIGAIEQHSSHLPLGTDAWWTRGDWRVRQNQVRSVGRCCRSRGVCPLTVSHGGVQ